MTAEPLPLLAEAPDPALSRRNVLIGGGLLVAAGLGLAGSALNRPRKLAPGDLERAVPDRIGQWQSAGTRGVILPEESELSRDTYDQVLSRVYVGGDGPPIMMVAAYGGNQSGNMQLHRPEACYPAAGFTLRTLGIVPVQALAGVRIPAKRIEAVSQTRTEQILYWTRIGDEFPVSASAQRWAVVRENLHGQVPDGILVRVSTIGQTAAEALPLLTSFIRSLVAGSGPAGRQLLVGRS
jgi:EpsI family protein